MSYTFVEVAAQFFEGPHLVISKFLLIHAVESFILFFSFSESVLGEMSVRQMNTFLFKI